MLSKLISDMQTTNFNLACKLNRLEFFQYYSKKNMTKLVENRDIIIKRIDEDIKHMSELAQLLKTEAEKI